MTNRVLVTLRQFNADASTSVERETPVLDERWRARRYDIVEELASIALGQAHKGSDALRREFMQCDRDSVTAVVADGDVDASRPRAAEEGLRHEREAVEELVMVKVALAADSSDVVTSLMLNVGPGSSSLRAMVTCCVPFSLAPPPETVLTSKIAVSSPSKVLSLLGVTVTDPDVDPDAMVKLVALNT